MLMSCDLEEVMTAVSSSINVVGNCCCISCMVGSCAVPWYAACAVYSDHYRSCIVPTQASFWQVHLPDSACVCCPCMDVLWSSCYHSQVSSYLYI